MGTVSAMRQLAAAHVIIRYGFMGEKREQMLSTSVVNGSAAVHVRMDAAAWSTRACVGVIALISRLKAQSSVVLDSQTSINLEKWLHSIMTVSNRSFLMSAKQEELLKFGIFVRRPAVHGCAWKQASVSSL